MTVRAYARDTIVSSEKSAVEIMTLLTKYKATATNVYTSIEAIGVAFVLDGRQIKMLTPLPTLEEVQVNKAGQKMGIEQARQAHAKVVRQRWRSLLLTVKAKLVSVQDGVETLEQAFMAHLVLAGGKTMGEVVLPQIQSGALPLLGTGKVAQ